MERNQQRGNEQRRSRRALEEQQWSGYRGNGRRGEGYDEDENRDEQEFGRDESRWSGHDYGRGPGQSGRNFEEWQEPRQFGERGGWATRQRSPGYAGQGYGSQGAGVPYEPYREDRGWFRSRESQGAFGQPQGREGFVERWIGRFTGKGPKGYQRSDERIREDVCDCLTADPWIDAEEIRITVSQGEVTLEGTVPERSMKRAAEDRIEEIAGVRDVNNSLRVQRNESGISSAESDRSKGSQSQAKSSPGRDGR